MRNKREDSPTKKRRQLLDNRLRILAFRFDTTMRHLRLVSIAIALPRLERLSLDEFQQMFGQGYKAQKRAAKNKKQMVKLIEEAAKRKFRVLED